jgi:hypothetical protein
MSKATQTQKVLEYIQTHGSIDGWRAVNELHIMRLAARISDLKALGIPIAKTMKTRRNEDGSFTSWAEYSIAS